MEINAYLSFAGNCAEALQFYTEVFGGRVTAKMTYGGSPMDSQIPPDWKDKIMHARIDLGGTVIMASDAMPGRAPTPQGFSLSISLPDPTEAERLFTALSEGGAIQMPLQPTFWAKRFGVTTDKYGTPWMINCE